MHASRYAELFRSEAREHCSTINRLLLALERDPDQLAGVDEVFRSVHTLKGASAAMGYTRAAELAHALEHALEPVRRGTLRVDGEVIDLLLRAADSLERAVEEPGEGGGVEEAIAGELRGLARPEEPAPASPSDLALAAERAGLPEGRALRVRVVIAASSPLPAVRAVMVLRNARELGEVCEVEPAESEIAAGAAAGPFSFALATAEEPATVRRALLAAGEVEALELEELAAEPSTAAGARAESVVRVRQSRLDLLVDQVGELLIARDRLRRAAAAHPSPELEEAVGSLSTLVGQLRDEILQLRMVPVGEAFDRFPRMVRDAARALGKQVELQLGGSAEEVDRSLLNEAADLLVHLLRNAVDHGIETPEERRAVGKPPTGRIGVHAERHGAELLIRVRDDGRGLQRERIVRAAVEAGVLPPERAPELTDAEVHRLITVAGLSTAERVTDVSGRGVGMDAVVSRVHAIGGAVEIQSREGEGCTFTVRLPLSLSIVRTLRVEAAGDSYCIPISAVQEVGEAACAGPEVELREERIPALDLSRLLADGDVPARRGPIPLVVLSAGEQRVALLVDALQGQQEAVVKPFDGVRGMIDLFSGATLTADGRPTLILDPARIAGRVGADAPRPA